MGGLVIKFRATLGFTVNGPSDDARVRDLSITVSPSHAARILAAQEESTTEADLHKAVAEAIADAYLRQGGGGRRDSAAAEHSGRLATLRINSREPRDSCHDARGSAVHVDARLNDPGPARSLADRLRVAPGGGRGFRCRTAVTSHDAS